VARELLAEKLARYLTFKRAAVHLAEVADGVQGRLLRPPTPPEGYHLPPLEALAPSEESTELVASMKDLLAQRRPPDTDHLTAARVSLTRQIAAIRRALIRERRMSFEEVFGKADRLVQAMTVFGLLTLMSQGEVEVDQDSVFGDIDIRLKDRR